MGLMHLWIADFRNLVSVEFAPIFDGFNFIYGSNGSGKTSLLEAIYYLNLGRSFRSTISERIVHNAAEKLALFAHILPENNSAVPVGLERYQNGEINIRINGKDVKSVAELATLMPVQLMDSHSHRLLDGGPAFRRQYLDWGGFHLSPDFMRLWRQFDRALKQRNAALRAQLPKKEIDNWTYELIEQTAQFDQIRRDYVGHLMPLLMQSIADLLSISNLEIIYYPGWDGSTHNYADVLARSFDRDRDLGYTQFGPHKADLKITINQVPAKDILSRGQQKLFVCGMMLAQGILLQDHVNKRPIYLVDDLPSELDSVSSGRFIDLLSRQKGQFFVTAVGQQSAQDFLRACPTKMFHVEHGRVKEVGLTHEKF